jgi:integrase
MASIIKRPDRPLPYFVYWREPVTKAQRSKAFATKRAAEDFRDTVSTEIRHGTYTDRRPVPFQTFAEDWLTRTKPAVSPNTGALYEWAVRKYLIPGFGLTPIQNLTAECIERWQADLLAKGTPGPRSVEICRTALGTMLKDARMKGRLYVNPMEAVRRFDVPKRELHYLTVAQVKDLCERVGRVYGVLFLVMAFCGLRIGEVLGLQWPDLDLGRRLFVQRQALWRRKRDCQDGKPRWHLAEPKSKAGTRVVEIPAPLVAFLVAHRADQNGGPNPLGLVFPSEDGTPLYPGNVRRRAFQPALTALGLTGIRMHDFRRTFIALHVEAGTHPKLVQERVGHSNIKLTMDVYGTLAGKMALAEEQTARLDSMASTASLTLVNTWSAGATKTSQNNQSQPEAREAISA